MNGSTITKKDVSFLNSTQIRSLHTAGYTTIESIANASFEALVSVPKIGFKSAYNLKRHFGASIDYIPMHEIVNDELNEPVEIENKKIGRWETKKQGKPFVLQPVDFHLETTTVWSFPDRGDWASHTPDYRGNWSPRVARNIILRYSKEGDTVLDPMVGGGTTMVEAALTGRNSIGVDVNPDSALIAKNRLSFLQDYADELPTTDHRVYVGDARNLNLIVEDSVDLIATHPPYANIIKYGKSVPGDLSLIPDYEIFSSEMAVVAKEAYRVLKKGGYCAVLLGDTHNKSHYVPIATKVMMQFLKAGFVLKEDVIKHEWNCSSNGKWGKTNNGFLLTMHEHLFVFRKLDGNEKLKDYRNSSSVMLSAV